MAQIAAALLGTLRSQPELVPLPTRVKVLQALPTLVADQDGTTGRWDRAGCAFVDAFTGLIDSVEAFVLATTVEVSGPRAVTTTPVRSK